MLLYMASRAQLVAQRIRPAREMGHLVLADRFISSTLAYQGAAGGIPTGDILTVGHLALGDCWPDLTIVFDVDEQTAAGRLSRDLDRIEQKGVEYHRTVRRGYLEQVRADPEHYLLIDARTDAQTVFERMVAGLAQRLA
jgi:dTMP kinase